MAGFMSAKTKRKDLDDVYDEFSEFSLNSPARKIRRLDAELPPIIEDEDLTVHLPVEHQMADELASVMPELGAGVVDAGPSIPVNEEKALVLYRPVDNPFALSRVSSNVSFRVHSDLVYGLKNQSFWPANPNAVTVEDVPTDDKQAVANNNLAVVPWVPSVPPSQAFSAAASDARVMYVEEPMEAEEEAGGASMEVEEDMQQGLQQWPHHCLIPQPLQNASPPYHVVMEIGKLWSFSSLHQLFATIGWWCYFYG